MNSRSTIAMSFATALGLTLSLVSDSSATVTALAADTQTKIVGAAANSCNYLVSNGRPIADEIFRLVPAKGAGVNQFLTLAANLDEIQTHLERDTHAEDILSYVSDPRYSRDTARSNRQYGIVNTNGEADSVTCQSAWASKKDTHGYDGRYAYSVQGNTLTGEDVVTGALQAFESESSCNDMAQRLFNAMAAAEARGGDNRCVGGENAAIRVLAPSYDPNDADPELRSPYIINIEATCTEEEHKTGCPNAHAEIVQKFNAWRATHPCGYREQLQPVNMVSRSPILESHHLCAEMALVLRMPASSYRYNLDTVKVTASLIDMAYPIRPNPKTNKMPKTGAARLYEMQLQYPSGKIRTLTPKNTSRIEAELSVSRAYLTERGEYQLTVTGNRRDPKKKFLKLDSKTLTFTVE